MIIGNFDEPREMRSLYRCEGKEAELGPEWYRVRNTLMKALWPYDEARRAVREALGGIGRLAREGEAADAGWDGRTGEG